MEQNIENTKPYDLTTLYAISENHPEFLNKLLLIFSETITKDIEIIKEAAHNGNWNEVGQTAHKIKPSVAHFGIHSLKDVIFNLEHQGDRSISEKNELVLTLVNTINNVLAHLNDEFPDVFQPSQY